MHRIITMYNFRVKLDEQLSPSELRVRNDFFSKQNTQKVVALVHGSVDRYLTDGSIVDVMHEVFTQSLGQKNGLVGTTLAALNDLVSSTILSRQRASASASIRSRRVGFETSKIPTTILPRPSFSYKSDDDDAFFDLNLTRNVHTR
jgi:hypothetical protein